MSKRKGTSGADEDVAKCARNNDGTAVAATSAAVAGAGDVGPAHAAAAAAAFGSSAAVEPAALSLLSYYKRLAAKGESTELVTLLKRKFNSDTLKDKWAAVCRLLLDDARRPGGPLISLSHVTDDGPPLLFLLIRELCNLHIRDKDSLRFQKAAALSAFEPALPGLIARVRREHNPRLSHGGLNALQVLVEGAAPASPDSWTYQMADALLDCGCDVNARDSLFCTPLFKWRLDRKEAGGTHPCGPLLLLERGADIDALCWQNNTAIHWLARCYELAVLRALSERGWLAVADLSLRDEQGRTALEVMEGRREIDPSSPERQAIEDLLRAESARWCVEVRPAIREQLEEFLVSDVAGVVLSYFDR